MKKLLSLFILISSLMFAGQASALSVSADYTYTGTPGDYVLDFTLTNNIPEEYDQELYFFGVDLPYDARQESPSGWGDWGHGSPWNCSGYGGSNTNYASTWITGTGSGVESGDSLSGFKVYASSIPNSISFYTFGVGEEYLESDAFFKSWNPGFESFNGASEDINGTSTPEPGSMALMGMGLAALLRRRKVQKQ